MAPSDHRMPRVYKEGAKILKEVMLSKRGLKDVIYSNRNKMLYKKLFVLLNTYLDHQNSINKFVEETSLTQNVKDEFVAKILCTELLNIFVLLPYDFSKVYAVDKDPKRYKYMKEVVELAQGSGVVSTILSDIFDIKMADYTDVEYVLVDPSCSGTGITERAKIDNNASISAGRIRNLAGFQRDLLSRVCTYFTHVKRIVYCTCSVREEENEQVVEDIVAKHGDRWEVEDLTHHPALVGWKHFGSEKYAHGRRCFYALPSDYCTGFFAAVLTRKYDSSGKNSDGSSWKNIDGPTRNNTVGSGEKNIFNSTGKNSRREVEESKKTSEGELEEESSSQERDLDDKAGVETLEQSKKKKKKHKKKDLGEDQDKSRKKHENDETVESCVERTEDTKDENNLLSVRDMGSEIL
ncbi:uncharacterized protein LOC103517857 [Diaphorina citri]|uniref:Uncharacterized protein LOC103517857 n=1 Tax=Diaphorina citri TaxID=121845 RepID=A0A1S3DG91_DIACI|nr:uncharacterized protein LOC103517857 [Diaphorina citri]